MNTAAGSGQVVERVEVKMTCYGHCDTGSSGQYNAFISNGMMYCPRVAAQSLRQTVSALIKVLCRVGVGRFLDAFLLLPR